MEVYAFLGFLVCLLCHYRSSNCDVCDFEREYCNWESKASLTQSVKFKRTSIGYLRNFGPKFDATFKNSSGHLQYLTGRYGKGSDSLESDWFGPPDSNVPLYFRLTFKYTIYRNNSSLHLTVQYRTHQDLSDLETFNATDANEWKSANLTLGPIKAPFKLIMNANVQEKYSYVGVDDIEVTVSKDGIHFTSTCSLEERNCGDGTCFARDTIGDLKKDCQNGEDEVLYDKDKWPQGARCNFEEGMCGWRNIRGQSYYFDWVRHRGKTPTQSTGPSVDHTIGTDKGFYVYIDSTVDKSSHTAVLESPLFPPLPKAVRDNSSVFLDACKLRFFYHTRGRFHSFLKIEVVNECNRKSELVADIRKFRSIDKWIYKTITLKPEWTGRYRIRFIGLLNKVTDNGDLGLDDISLTLDCFPKEEIYSLTSSCQNETLSLSPMKTPKDPIEVNDKNDTSRVKSDHQGNLVATNLTRYDFRTCNSFGKQGPSQEQCDFVYKRTNVRVDVISEGIYKGVQVWTVPENATYFIHAAGAGGGEGVKTAKRSRGAIIEGKFTLTQGEKIYILVGQKGTKACFGAMISDKVRDICRKGHSNESAAMRIGGAGGGGGASFVFKMDLVTNLPIILLAAGGGGGLPYDLLHDNITTNPSYYRNVMDTGPGLNGHTNPTGAGGGGGLNGSSNGFPQAGKSLLEGGEGGDSCKEVQEKLNWNTPGGFGGGGGACSSGGGGGGYTGGNAASEDKLFYGGQGGSSYARADAVNPKLIPGEKGDGFVEIDMWLPGCICEELCIIDNWKKKSYHCECLSGSQLRSDGFSCEVVVEASVFSNSSLNDTVTKELSLGALHLNLEYIIVIALVCTILTLSVVAIFICLAKRRQHKKHLKAVRLELITASQSFTIRPPHGNGNVTDRPLSNPRRNAEYNPTYDFGNIKQSDQQLKELNRNNLKLARPLGQGAFGEVYKGYLSSTSNIKGQAVAVKTLSAFSTQESELDFLMEAVILSKFHHPNIVNLIGVCFESQPRYIILELLDGGDLKTFLREMRPKPDMSPPLVTVLDLLMLAIDISRGCQHLEERHFIHRDIAARNCLLTCKGASRQAKIADFGMARDVYRSDYYKKGGKAMLPIKWMPPEAFLDGVFTSKTDVWSFGILLWEIFSMGYMPYPGRTNHDVMQYVTSGGRLEPPDKCPQSIVQLMSICWAAIPETRPNFTEVLQYLQGVSTNSDITRGELPNFVLIPCFGKDKSDSSISEKIPASVTIETTLNETTIDFDDNKLSDSEEEVREPLLRLSDSHQNASMDTNKATNKNDNSTFSSLIVQLPEEQCIRKSDKKNVCDTGNNINNLGSVDTMVQTSGSQDTKPLKKDNSRITNPFGRCSINEHSPLLTSDKNDTCEMEKEGRSIRLDDTIVDSDKRFLTKPFRSSLRGDETISSHASVKRMKSSNI